MELREAFSILEIEEGSSLDEVKTDYRRLCIVWHPDRFQNPELKAHAEEKLKRINLAFDIIKSSTAEAEVAPCLRLPPVPLRRQPISSLLTLRPQIPTFRASAKSVSRDSETGRLTIYEKRSLTRRIGFVPSTFPYTALKR